MNSTADPVLECRSLGVTYGDAVAVRGVDLTVGRGETIALLGPSGSGKTTLLYAIAGFLPVSSGQIYLSGVEVSSTRGTQPTEQRPVAMVFQHYGLWPHMNALDTVAYPLRRDGNDPDAARSQARDLLGQMRIEHLSARKPAELSGGEQQRVGLARALARHPLLYLLDEPTAHLDTVLKTDLQAELSERMTADGAAAIHATHDVEEALAVADRVVLLRDGSVVQIDGPEEIYAQPVDEWAAQLTGPASFVDGVVIEADGRRSLATGGERHLLDSRLGDSSGVTERPSVDVPIGPGRYLVRPDWVRFGGSVAATVRDVRYRGTHTDYRLETASGTILLRDPGPPRLSVGTTTNCNIVRVWRMSASL